MKNARCFVKEGMSTWGFLVIKNGVMIFYPSGDKLRVAKGRAKRLQTALVHLGFKEVEMPLMMEAKLCSSYKL